MGNREIVTYLPPANKQQNPDAEMFVTVGTSGMDTGGGISPKGLRHVDINGDAVTLRNGKKFYVVGRSRRPGGNGANMATAPAALGIEEVYTVLYTYLGNDTTGELLGRAVAEQGVHVVAEVGPEETDFSHIINFGNDRIIQRFPPETPIDGDFQPEHLPNRPHATTLLTTIPVDSWHHVYPKVVEHALTHGIKLAVSPGTPQLEDSLHPAFEQTVRASKIVSINAGDLRDVLETRGIRPGDEVPDLLDQAAEVFGDQAIYNTTDGGNGGYVRTKTGKIIYVPRFDDPEGRPVDSTVGAGDTQNSTFTFLVSIGFDPKEAAEIAAVQASNTVRYPGAQEGRRSLNDIYDQIRQTGFEAVVIFDPTGKTGPSHRRSPHTAIPLS